MNKLIVTQPGAGGRLQLVLQCALAPVWENSMDNLLMPFFGMMMLTLLVWLYMYSKRLGYMLANKIDAQQVATPEQMSELLPDRVNNPANNLKNLFELPVLFYVLCIYLHITGEVDQLHVWSAYVFFVGRAIHSVIHCTFNRVGLRFLAYLISALALWTMVVRCFIGLF